MSNFLFVKAVALMSKRHLGFTLMELIVVVVIIGVIATLAIQTYFKTIEAGRIRYAQNMLKSLYAGEKIYYVRTGHYCVPGGSSDPQCQNMGGSDIPQSLTLPAIQAMMLLNIPADSGFIWCCELPSSSTGNWDPSDNFACYAMRGSQDTALPGGGNADIATLCSQNAWPYQVWIKGDTNMTMGCNNPCNPSGAQPPQCAYVP